MITLEKNIDVIENEEEYEMICVDTCTDYLKRKNIDNLSNAFHDAGLIIDDEFDEEMIKLLYENSLKRFIERAVDNIKTDTFCVNTKHSLNKHRHIVERTKQIQSYIADCMITNIGYIMYCDTATQSVWHRYYAKTVYNRMYYSVKNGSLIYFINSIYNNIYNNESE